MIDDSFFLFFSFPDQSTNKLNACNGGGGGKITFQKYSHNNGDMNRHKLNHATSMLDLSLSSRNANHHNNYYSHHHHLNNRQQQQQRNSHYQQQQSQNYYHHHHASRSRYSLALTSQQQQQQQSNNYDPLLLLTPKLSSFNQRRQQQQQQRPPSVASCHYLFSSNQSANQSQQQQSKYGRYYGQFMFGASSSSILMPKSESTLSVPLNVSSSGSFNNNRFDSSSTPNKKEFIAVGDGNGNSNNNKLFNHGKCSPISININQFDSSTAAAIAINNMPISNHNDDDDDEITTDIGYNNNNNNENDDDDCHNEKINEQSKSVRKSTTKLIDNIIQGITGRSRCSSIRKSDSDASTFYNRVHNNNMKRSQIARNQLSNILYNNFYNKKLSPSAFGSEIILLSENEHGKHCVKSSSNKQKQQQQQQSGQFPRPHVYLPSVSSSSSLLLQESNTSRSNSCQQIAILNGENTDHYHNHLLLKKQNLSSSLMLDESSPLIGNDEQLQQQQQQQHQQPYNGENHIIRNGGMPFSIILFYFSSLNLKNFFFFRLNYI